MSQFPQGIAAVLAWLSAPFVVQFRTSLEIGLRSAGLLRRHKLSVGLRRHRLTGLLVEQTRRDRRPIVRAAGISHARHRDERQYQRGCEKGFSRHRSAPEFVRKRLMCALVHKFGAGRRRVTAHGDIPSQYSRTALSKCPIFRLPTEILWAASPRAAAARSPFKKVISDSCRNKPMARIWRAICVAWRKIVVAPPGNRTCERISLPPRYCRRR